VRRGSYGDGSSIAREIIGDVVVIDWLSELSEPCSRCGERGGVMDGNAESVRNCGEDSARAEYGSDSAG
jgi:hypothetical protein